MPYPNLNEIVLAITLLVTISAVMVPLARRLGIGPELGLLLSGVILGSSHMLGSPRLTGCGTSPSWGSSSFCS